MKILYLSFYFPPDLCAGSFRNGPLVDALSSKLGADSTVEVFTTFPNRYAEYTADASGKEVKGNVIINRVKLPHHNSGMFDQAKAFISYAKFVLKVTDSKEFDLVFASSSRLMTALLGAFLSKRYGKPLYLDIRDLFVDTIKDVLPEKLTFFAVPVFNILERWSFGSAKRINVVSEGFESYITNRYPRVPLSFFPNGIDKEFLDYFGDIQHSPSELLSDIPEILYAGNIGEGQGLENIIPSMAVRLQGKAKIKIIGSGGRLTKLVEKLNKLGCRNVEVQAPVDRQELLYCYQKADVLFLHLNSYDAFFKVLPSKIFEYAVTGKPMLAGVAGYAKTFIEKNISNAQVFAPCDVDAAVNAFYMLKMKPMIRSDFANLFSREVIMESMSADILATVER